MKGQDFDIEKFPAQVAYIVYWDYEHRVISNQTMYQETVWPLSLIDAIEIFAPEMAEGANVTFVGPTGLLTNTIVFEF